MATIKASILGDWNNYQLSCQYEITSQDAANNQSTITFTNFALWHKTEIPTTYPLGTISVNGVKIVEYYAAQDYGLQNYDQSNVTEIFDTRKFSVIVKHGSDGTGSFKITSDLKFRNFTSGYGFVCGNFNDTVTIGSIGRASNVSADDVILGNKCSVKWTPSSASLYYKLRFSLNSWNHTTDALYPNRTTEYTHTNYIIPVKDVAPQIKNSVSSTMVVTLYTYSDEACTNQIGSPTSATFTVTIPNSVKPTISNVNVALDNDSNSTINGWGVAVAGFTKVRISANGEGIYGSSISRFTISDGYSKTVSETSLNFTTPKITSSGEKTFTVTCTDTRGRTSAAVSKSITFIPYSDPSITGLVATRNAAGTSMSVTASWTFSSVGGRNSASAILEYKALSSSSWTRYGAISNNTPVNISVSKESSYDFRVTVTDSIGKNAILSSSSLTAGVLLDFKAGGKGLGVGKISEKEAMEVQLPAIFYNTVYIGADTLADYILKVVNGTV